MKHRSKPRQLAAAGDTPRGLLTESWRPWLENARAKEDFERHFERHFDEVDRKLAELILGPELAARIGLATH